MRLDWIWRVAASRADSAAVIPNSAACLCAAIWRAWWKSQKPSGIPPELPAAHNPEDDRYAKPKPVRPEEPAYYGKRIFSQSVLFVIDVSKSMDTTIRIPPDEQEKLGHLASGRRIQVAKQAVSNAIEKLDPRARFNVVFFSTTGLAVACPSVVDVGVTVVVLHILGRSGAPAG